LGDDPGGTTPARGQAGARPGHERNEAGSGHEPRRPRAITIAGSDSGGGAGIQADLKTFAVLGVWGTAAVTSVTVQNTRGVSGVADVAPDVVAAQVSAVLTDIGADAGKTGMLSSAPIVEAVAGAIEEAGLPNLVVDPVFVSKHGHPLLRPDAVDALRRRILPLAALVTPNLPEAAGLAGFEVRTRRDMERAGAAILDLGPGAVLVKGGHLEEGRADDLLVRPGGAEWVAGERIDSPHTHGTGCVLSAAIAAYLALGQELGRAVRLGKAFVTEAIRHAARIGGGIGPVDPAWRLAEGDGGRRGTEDERTAGAEDERGG
jgi:hydroxymethylpyrimidine kinase/phosphomethylpyrimidine kinase